MPPRLEGQFEVRVAQVQVEPVGEDDLGDAHPVPGQQRDRLGIDAVEQAGQVLVVGRLVEQPLPGPLCETTSPPIQKLPIVWSGVVVGVDHEPGPAEAVDHRAPRDGVGRSVRGVHQRDTVGARDDRVVAAEMRGLDVHVRADLLQRHGFSPWIGHRRAAQEAQEVLDPGRREDLDERRLALDAVPPEWTTFRGITQTSPRRGPSPRRRP